MKDLRLCKDLEEMGHELFQRSLGETKGNHEEPELQRSVSLSRFEPVSSKM